MKSRMIIGAMMAVAMSSNLPLVQRGARKEVDWFGDANEPINTGRREEKDLAALAKAEAKRERKAKKRNLNKTGD